MLENPSFDDLEGLQSGVGGLFQHAHGNPSEEYLEKVAAGEKYRQAVLGFGQSVYETFCDPATATLIRKYYPRKIKYLSGTPIVYTRPKNHLYSGIFLRGEERPEMILYLADWLNTYTSNYTMNPTPVDIESAQRAFKTGILRERKGEMGWNFYCADEDGEMVTRPRGLEYVVASRRFRPEDLMNPEDRDILPLFCRGVETIIVSVNQGLERDALHGMPIREVGFYTEALGMLEEVLRHSK